MKAMELVAASKMRKSVQQTLSNRPYAAALARMTDEVRAQLVGLTSLFLTGRSVAGPRTTLAVVLASDRGLCGGFNTYIVRKAMEFLRSRTMDSLKLMTVGRRAERAVRQFGYPMLAAFPAISNHPSFDQARPIGNAIVQTFLEGSVDRVFLVYTDFHSALSQVPVAMQLLPVTKIGSNLSADHLDVWARAGEVGTGQSLGMAIGPVEHPQNALKRSSHARSKYKFIKHY